MLSGIHADFGEKHWLFVRQGLQAGKVGPHFRLAFQINVVGEDIQKWQAKIFGRWMPNVSREAIWGLFLYDTMQSMQELFDTSRRIPTHDQRRNFVSDRKHQDRRMVGEAAGVLSCPIVEIFQTLWII